jgi:hypothetical protein
MRERTYKGARAVNDGVGSNLIPEPKANGAADF